MTVVETQHVSQVVSSKTTHGWKNTSRELKCSTTWHWFVGKGVTASQEMWRAPRLISVLNVCLNYSRVGKYHTGNVACSSVDLCNFCFSGSFKVARSHWLIELWISAFISELAWVMSEHRIQNLKKLFKLKGRFPLQRIQSREPVRSHALALKRRNLIGFRSFWSHKKWTWFNFQNRPRIHQQPSLSAWISSCACPDTSIAWSRGRIRRSGNRP